MGWGSQTAAPLLASTFSTGLSRSHDRGGIVADITDASLIPGLLTGVAHFAFGIPFSFSSHPLALAIYLAAKALVSSIFKFRKRALGRAICYCLCRPNSSFPHKIGTYVYYEKRSSCSNEGPHSIPHLTNSGSASTLSSI